MTFMIRAFREGKLGRWTFDDLEGPQIPIDHHEPAGTANVVGDVQGVESTTPETSLDAAVSHAVRTFLEANATAQARMAEGKDLSISQQRKADTRAKHEARLARWKVKGYGAASQTASPPRRAEVR